MKKEKKVKNNNNLATIDDIPEILPVLPLRDIVIFPYMIFPVLVGREQSVRAANYAIENGKFIFLASQKKSNVDDPKKSDIFKDGTVARIMQILKLPNGLMKILVDGLIQGKISEFTDRKDFFEAKIRILLPKIDNDHEMNALIRQMSQLFKDYVKINRNIPQETISSFDAIDEPDRKLFYAAANINQSIDVKQQILTKLELKEQYYEIEKLEYKAISRCRDRKLGLVDYEWEAVTEKLCGEDGYQDEINKVCETEQQGCRDVSEIGYKFLDAYAAEIFNGTYGDKL